MKYMDYIMNYIDLPAKWKLLVLVQVQIFIMMLLKNLKILRVLVNTPLPSLNLFPTFAENI